MLLPCAFSLFNNSTFDEHSWKNSLPSHLQVSASITFWTQPNDSTVSALVEVLILRWTSGERPKSGQNDVSALRPTILLNRHSLKR